MSLDDERRTECPTNRLAGALIPPKLPLAISFHPPRGTHVLPIDPLSKTGIKVETPSAHAGQPRGVQLLAGNH